MSLETYMGYKEFENFTPITIKEAMLLNEKKDYRKYCPEIVEVIEKVKNEGDYPYNSTIKERCIKDGLFNSSCSTEFMDYYVYTSQSYTHKKIDFEQVNKYIEKTNSENFVEPTIEVLKELAKSKKKIQIIALGKEEFKGTVLFDADDRLFYMPLRNKRRGFNNLIMAKIKL